MKLKFKIQPYQTAAVDAVADCFAGQVNAAGVRYRIDPGKQDMSLEYTGFRNEEFHLTEQQVLDNIQTVQQQQNLPISSCLESSAGCRVNLDVEMETGTGKTYCYIKTMFELNQRYGWSKFIIVVPSIAIREGVYKSLEITADHFTESYGKKARFFIYNSRQLHQLESFSSDAGINIMVINIQAFNATGKDNRRIYEELDDFQSRKPIDVISSNRPILILDEPQKMEGKKTLDALAKFKPLMILRYSATHRTTYNKVHRLDALDAYNHKLVKKINARGITVKGLAGTNAYLYLESIEISRNAPVARLEMEVRQGNGIKRMLKRLTTGRNLYDESNGLDQYRGFVLSEVNGNTDSVEFSNGHRLTAGEATGDVTETTVRRIQIRETITAHLEKEKLLFSKGIKVLSLFFIDEVVKYRDYSQSDENGEYARIFEEEYRQLVSEYVDEELALDNHEYRSYLKGISPRRTHNGYFSIDRKTKHLADPKIKKRGEEAGLTDDVDAYDLILKEKERLLSFEEPVRFIFSHSALREGWDNPNVFVMCMLKHSDNTISRRQEVGRGLRLAVNQHGERMDNPLNVHDINVLTVVANESYKDFVDNLQKEITETLSQCPRLANKEYFANKVITTESGTVTMTEEQATDLEFYLIRHGYIDQTYKVTELYHQDRKAETIAELPESLKAYTPQVIGLINSVFSEAQLLDVANDRQQKTNPLNGNFRKKEFRELWKRINRKAIYRVDFDSEELITNCIRTLSRDLRVSRLSYSIQSGIQLSQVSDQQLKQAKGFQLKESKQETHKASVYSNVSYDLLGKVAENTKLTRKTVAAILSGITQEVFQQFQQNPEHFISEASRLINEQKASIVIERLRYDPVTEEHDIDIFTEAQIRQDFSQPSEKLRRHVYDYLVSDSKVEREFAKELDASDEVVVYAKLPKGFQIPTPVGNYNPDWAISFKEGSVKHIYFVAETKGTMSTLQLRGIEERKIDCARKFFARLNETIDAEKVNYGVVTDFDELMEIVGGE
ncbi:DEAD/DEAH box helicase family protein [Prosthecochloris sp. N3]|uniref:DEAD/DEAH box helicase family protein n=1 Tax=Prosthecochloris ethylica TaxID=2743976 RepID=A0ABR9XQV1_9CHLB|nr:DEAD/DEAH box helicase family protein [Prosthecochloris ethylica]MBF0585404.1 DEAD/DEAH box helicase family protein [Prosthecochloris ethylica]MBF0636190.1 DEAD/DEAH box helicase family protein [Prosthecochloris ethylica]NUK46633.1 DEAD/DEAH box helicase family protein [Prosthecochloris ethylica]